MTDYIQTNQCRCLYYVGISCDFNDSMRNTNSDIVTCPTLNSIAPESLRYLLR